jgi:hypothetical protein
VVWCQGWLGCVRVCLSCMKWWYLPAEAMRLAGEGVMMVSRAARDSSCTRCGMRCDCSREHQYPPGAVSYGLGQPAWVDLVQACEYGH